MRQSRFVIAFAAFAAACSSQSVQTSEAPTVSTIPPVQGDTRTISGGLKYIDVVTGGGDEATNARCVYAEYTGWLADGKKIDSSHDPMPNGQPGEPAAFVLQSGAVMQGWELGFRGMRVGGKRRLFIPYALAYGERGVPPLVPPRSALVFDVELIAVMAPGRESGKACPALRR